MRDDSKSAVGSLACGFLDRTAVGEGVASRSFKVGTLVFLTMGFDSCSEVKLGFSLRLGGGVRTTLGFDVSGMDGLGVPDFGCIVGEGVRRREGSRVRAAFVGP